MHIMTEVLDEIYKHSFADTQDENNKDEEENREAVHLPPLLIKSGLHNQNGVKGRNILVISVIANGKMSGVNMPKFLKLR